MSELTKKALAESIEELLRIKSLDKITVKEITDSCGLTRNTFYYHFKDIYDLLSWIFVRRADESISKFVETNDWEKGFLEGLNYLYNNKKMINHVYKSINRADLDKYLDKVVGMYALKLVGIQAKGIEISENAEKITADFYKNAFVGAVIQWIEKNMETSPRALAALCNGMFKGTVKEALKSADEIVDRIKF